MTYLKLPRKAAYVDAGFMKQYDNRRYPADLNANYQSHTLLPTVGNDGPLVRSYLQHFFID